MLIATKSIPKYFHSLKFPVSILSEKGPQVVFVVGKAGLLAFCDVGAVIAFGTYNRIKYFRVNRPIAELENLRLKLGILPTAEDSRNLVKDGRSFAFHGGRARAFSPTSKSKFK